MPKILKSSQVYVDKGNSVNIEVISYEQDLNIPDGQGSTDLAEDAEDGESIERKSEEYAESLIEAARQRADSIIAEANRMADETYAGLDEAVRKATDDAREQGKASGYMEGYNEGLTQTEKMRQDAEKTYKNALSEREELLRNVEPEIVDLIVKIVKKLISDEIEINPGVISYLIKKGLTGSTASGQHKVLVSPEDYEAAKASLEDMHGLTNASVTLDLVCDQNLGKSDCVIETPFGNIDCGLNRQFDSLKKAIYYILNNAEKPRM